ncbi:type II toxin-antitoxin system RelE/ParE family toxin [Actinoallomurus soli]|uniref:type II toxin-antitoxin system RelE/ParE family toxin n=1 Tax=Actinoallomurus soli TaxID=2952535 RepID=UPI0027E26BDF|nr:type II toxin-antitoxin system RelE/ParE family toxin [Actinoallomurus soli]
MCYTSRQIRVTNELLAWINALDDRSKAQVVDAIDRLAEAGPSLGRPLVDRLEGSRIHKLKELRPVRRAAPGFGSFSRSTHGARRSS